MVFAHRDGFARFDRSEVSWFEWDENTLWVHGPGKPYRLVRAGQPILGDLAALGFVLISGRCAVNIDHVKELEPLSTGDWFVRLRNGTRMRVTPAHTGEVLRRTTRGARVLG